MRNPQQTTFLVLAGLAVVALGFFVMSVWPQRNSNPRPAVLSSDPFVGKSNAKVTIVAFTDFECDFCRAEVSTLKSLVAGNTDSIKLVHKDYPLAQHVNAARAALIGRCAQDQGKFWQMYDVLFNHQTELDTVQLATLAGEAGADVTALSACVQAGSNSAKVQASIAEGQRLGLTDVPTMYVNSERFTGLTDFTTLQNAVNRALQ